MNEVICEENKVLYANMREKIKLCDGTLRCSKHIVLKDHKDRKLSEKVEIKLFLPTGEKVEIIEKENLIEYFESKKFVTWYKEHGLIPSPLLANATKLIAAFVQKQFIELESERITVLPQGLSEVDGKYFWVLGDAIISKNDISKVEVEKTCLSLHSMKEEKDPIAGCCSFMEIDNHYSPLLMIYSCFSVLQDLFLMAGVPDRFVLALISKTGDLKSSLARIPTNIYAEKDFFTLASSLRSLQVAMNRITDVPILLDDFNKSSYKEVVRKKGAMLSEIIQAYSERATISKMQGNQEVEFSIRCGLIVTAEEMPENPSTVNRCIFVEKDMEIDVRKLQKVQEMVQEENIFGELYLQLIEYVMTDLDNIKKRIKQDFLYWRDKKDEFSYDEKEVAGYRRICSNYALLMTTTSVFCYFLAEKREDPTCIENLRRKIQTAIKNACIDTMKHLSLNDSSHEYIDEIAMWYQQEENVWAKSVKRYLKDSNLYCGIDEGEYLWIRGKVLLNHFQDKFQDRIVTLKEISSQLRKYSLLKVDTNGKCSHHLPGADTKKRFYCIYIKQLCDISCEFTKREYGI